MGALLKVIAFTSDLAKCEHVVDPIDIDTISCIFNEEKESDIKEDGRKGRVVIGTKSSNRIAVETGVDGRVLFILADSSFKVPYSMAGVNGALVLHTAYKMHFDDEKKFAQYVLGKGGTLPEPIGDMD